MYLPTSARAFIRKDSIRQLDHGQISSVEVIAQGMHVVVDDAVLRPLQWSPVESSGRPLPTLV
jgi:hypothetical protein